MEPLSPDGSEFRWNRSKLPRERSNERPGSTTNLRRGFRFGKELRVRARREFVALQRSGKAIHTPHFVVLSMERSGSGPTRLGVTVSRRVGNAVTRNRIKRLLREFFRLHHNRIRAGRDYLLIAKRGAEHLSYRELADEVAGAIGF